MLPVTSYNRIHDINMAYHWWLTLITAELAGFLQSQVTFFPLSTLVMLETIINLAHTWGGGYGGEG